MLLAIDIGNTSITIGLFENDVLIDKFSFKHNSNRYLDFYQDKFKNFGKNIKDCIICSVANELTQVVADTIKTLFGIEAVIVSSKINLGVKLAVEYPDKIGADRIANASAANALYTKPAIIVDMGTATTFDIINEKGDFIGGVIFPGIETQIHSLFTNTSQLPDININQVEIGEKTINSETKQAILAGIIKGHAYAIEGLIEDCEKELNQKPVIILTGGHAELISHYFRKNSFDLVRQNLTLEGINYIFNLNKQQLFVTK